MAKGPRNLEIVADWGPRMPFRSTLLHFALCQPSNENVDHSRSAHAESKAHPIAEDVGQGAVRSGGGVLHFMTGDVAQW